MKNLLYLLLLFPTMLYAQSEDSCTSIKFRKVVLVDSVSKDELFNRARLWFANTFNDSKKVLEISDKETGELVGKGAIPYHSRVFMSSGATAGWINYTIRIFLKDGRYKYEITDFIHQANPGNQYPYNIGIVTTGFCPSKSKGLSNPIGWQRKVWKEMVELSTEHKRMIVESLKKAMNEQASKSDW